MCLAVCMCVHVPQCSSLLPVTMINANYKGNLRSKVLIFINTSKSQFIINEIRAGAQARDMEVAVHWLVARVMLN